MHPMSKKEKKPEDVTPEEQTEQAVPTEETEAEAPNPLLEELEALKKSLSDQEDKFLRLAAEYDNYRRRSQKEKESAWSDAKADTLRPSCRCTTTWSGPSSRRPPTRPTRRAWR